MRQILLVEDSSTHALAVKKPLETAGYRVLCVDRLDDAVARVSQDEFDSIILDLQLPDSGGLDTYLRMQQAAREIPIVVLTSNDDERLALQMLRGGAQDYLVKGEVTGDWILRSIRYAIERVAASRQRQTNSSVALKTQELQVDVEEIDKVTVVRIKNKLLTGNEVIEELNSQFYKWVDEQGRKKFVVNCDEIDYLANSVLSQWLSWDQKIRMHGGSMRICNLRHQVRDQIKVRKLLARFDICLDEETALRGF